MENKSIATLLEESREKRLRIQDQEREDEIERLRVRSLLEANLLIENFKKEHKRKTKTTVRIYVTIRFDMNLERCIYQIRFFIDGKLIQNYIINQDTAEILTKGIEATPIGEYTNYVLFSNVS